MALNQTLAKRGATNTGQDDFVLDNDFALIEGARTFELGPESVESRFPQEDFWTACAEPRRNEPRLSKSDYFRVARKNEAARAADAARGVVDGLLQAR